MHSSQLWSLDPGHICTCVYQLRTVPLTPQVHTGPSMRRTHMAGCPATVMLRALRCPASPLALAAVAAAAAAAPGGAGAAVAPVASAALDFASGVHGV